MEMQRRLGQRGMGHVVGLGIALLFTFVMLFTTWYVWRHHSTAGAWICAALLMYGLYGVTLAALAIRKDQRGKNG